jgi:putative transposase
LGWHDRSLTSAGPWRSGWLPGRLLIVSEHHLRLVLTEYLLQDNTARPHRALGQFAPAQVHTRPPKINLAEYRIRRKQVLGGLTHEYQIAA